MEYSIRNENGEHIREPRNHKIGDGRKANPSPIVAQRFAARLEGGFCMNRDRQAQKDLRKAGANERNAFRLTLTVAEQLIRINERPGLSLRERVRLLMQLGSTASIEAARLIIIELKEGAKTQGRRLGAKFEKQYAAQFMTI